MHSKTAQTILVLFLSTICLQNLQLAHGDADLIIMYCRTTDFYKECCDCVDFVAGRNVSTDLGVLKAVMTCGARAVGALHSDLLANVQKTTEPALKEALTVCLNKVEAVIQRPVIEAGASADKRDFRGTEGHVQEILTLLSVCDDAARSKARQFPDVVVSDLATVQRDWSGIVFKMLHWFR